MVEGAPKRYLVIMPAYNEAANIEAVIHELRQVVGTADLVVVDDASRDDTARRARDLGAVVLCHPCNLGYGGAVQTGFRYAVERGYDFAVLMDADGQHDPRNIPALLDVVQGGQADVAVGSRFLGRMEYQAGWLRRFGAWVFQRVASLATGERVTDPTSGFQALNASALRFLAWDNYPTDFPDTDVLLTLHMAGFRVREVPVVMRERRAGVSMHTNWGAFYYVAKMFLSILMVFLREWTRDRRRGPSSGGSGVEGQVGG
ncbi:MAG: glycosyltransferase family 2 protein [Anaerolineae bacterium]